MISQSELVNLEDLVAADHPYRVYKELLDFESLMQQLTDLDSVNGPKGFCIDRLFLCLLLQFMENISDREAERFLRENNAAKWFCGFSLLERTPDHSVFCRARSRIGTQRLSKLFAQIRDQLSAQGYMNEVFTFVDATHLISKSNLWKERDQALKEKHDKLNNDVLPKVAADKQARIGCKGKDKYWYGYKQHTSVDMQSGLINKVAITPANLTDAQGMQHVCPRQGAVYGDKGYCTQPARNAAARKGIHLAAIRKNNMKEKNRDLDRWYSGIRSPYERVFSQRNPRVRYRGVCKNQFSAFMQAISFNLKRLRVLNQTPLLA
ncbi:MAG: transposase [Endozoicomonas sp. (ex Botrylloides leachii)]|nr:transposase [Endozoicomonas sp. (ex Botrylloides leachii)]